MPDITKYSSVSISLGSKNELEAIQEHYHQLHGVYFSMAKLIESLAREKMKEVHLKKSTT
jgi:hypothetical protein|tara:strand:+ start:44 stop:223 length:180 start_codon:yes stop_codon:yes gene_type:complete